MYSVTQIQIDRKHELYDYCDRVTRAANNMYNTTLFYIRQVMTGTQKEPDKLTKNEKEVLDIVAKVVTKSNGKYKMPTAKKFLMSYGFLDYLFKVTNNPDYFCSDLPSHIRQNAIKRAVQDVKNFFASIRAYREDPSKFVGEPKLPHYKRKGGRCTAYSSNQECTVKPQKDGTFEIKLPTIDIHCKVGNEVKGNLKQTEIKPVHDIFVLIFVFEEKKELPPLKPKKRICSIDFGVNNLAAITNNIGAPCLLFKGNALKSANQWYNKELARVQSAQMSQTGKKFFASNQTKRICVKRNNYTDDFIHKTAKGIILWCLLYRIDTIVLGINKLWKLRTNLGKVNNQNFVDIPFYKLQKTIKYLAERHGIRVVEQEESYTSKASFFDNDYIPVFGDGPRTKRNYSGKRVKRGIYKTADNTLISADLNGSANIGRKAYPDLFNRDTVSSFNDIIIIKHPDVFLNEYYTT